MGNSPSIPSKALEKINDNARSSDVKLALDDLYDLHVVPKEVSALTHLQKLSIARCRLSALSNLSNLTTLRELNLSFNLLPDNCDWDQLSIMSNLKILDLSRNSNITVVPAVITSSLVFLETLNLGSSMITTLPASISSLTCLKVLDVTCCKITSIPASVYELPCLEELNLYFNRLEELPPRQANRPMGLQMLTRMSLSSNRLTSLPDDLFVGMTKLNNIDLWENRLTNLPSSISQCNCLSMLLASRNLITAYPEHFSLLKALVIVNFDHNALPALPPLASLTNLRKLCLRANAIATLPSWIPPLPRIEEVDLRDNPFSSVPEPVPAVLSGLITSLPNEIVPHLYISGQSGAENIHWLRSHNVELIICVAAEISPKYPQTFHYICVPCMDNDKYDVTSHFDMTYMLIESCVSKRNNVLVHCAQGRSRSGAIVVAYVMQKLRLHYELALERVCQKRPMVRPNFGFARMMKTWGATRGLPSPPPPSSPSPSSGTKIPPKSINESVVEKQQPS